MTTLEVAPGDLGLDDLKRLSQPGMALAFADGWQAPVAAARATVDAIAKGEASVYGVNTGFGMLARTRIPGDQLRDLQRRLVLSHSAGTGPPLADDAVRLVLALKANALARGYSGVRASMPKPVLTP